MDREALGQKVLAEYRRLGPCTVPLDDSLPQTEIEKMIEELLKNRQASTKQSDSTLQPHTNPNTDLTKARDAHTKEPRQVDKPKLGSYAERKKVLAALPQKVEQLIEQTFAQTINPVRKK